MSEQALTALYIRVSSRQQELRSQEPDLRRWVNAFAADDRVDWYSDKATGRSMDRPGWRRLEQDFRAGKITRLVVWRLDRLGRTASGLTALFDELQERGVNLVSLRDGVDLSTPAGRLMANVLASVAAYETEVRGERVAAGQAAAKAAGKQWGGSKKGRRLISADKVSAIQAMRNGGEPVAVIARAVGVSRPTVYSVLKGDSS